MPTPANRSKYQRSHLFLLRVWCDVCDEDASGEPAERSAPHWHGRVQRTVSGEAHNFAGTAGLIAVLERMLDQARPPTTNSRPPKKPNASADLAGADLGGGGATAGNNAPEGSQ